VDDANQRTPLTWLGGYLYGAVQGCGRFAGCTDSPAVFPGAIYRVDTGSGTAETVHTFASSVTGGNPTLPVTQAQDGAFHGVTEDGGAYGYGVVYRMDADGTLTTLHSFDGNEGYYASSALAEGDGGWLYGTTVSSEFGSGPGTLFRVNAAGDFETLSTFPSEGPAAGVIRGRDGLFYGVTPNDGMVFRADGDGNLTELTYLPGSTWGPLTQDAEGFFHGAVSVATTGPALPDGFELGDPPTFFDVTTTATFAGEIEICFSYAGVSVPDPATAFLLHYEGTRWEDVTTSRDPAAQIICGRVTSLSPFVIGNGATGGGTTRSGFYEPVSPEAGFLNTVKGGSTVPLKFEVTVNGVEKTDTAGLVFSVSQVPCEGGAEDPVDFVVAGSTSLRYDAAEGVFTQNWKTPKTTGACYVVRLTTESDGQSLQATFTTK